MQNDELILLGTITRTHGFQGAVVVALEGEFSEGINETEPLFVDVDGKMVPFFIDWTKVASPKTIILKFDYYNSEKESGEFVGARIYSDYSPGEETDDNSLPVDLIGYLIRTPGGEDVGSIKKVLSFPMQVMFEIEAPGESDILVPFNAEWLVERNDKRKIIILALPEGLTGIND